jgi:hypothetical protein
MSIYREWVNEVARCLFYCHRALNQTHMTSQLTFYHDGELKTKNISQEKKPLFYSITQDTMFIRKIYPYSLL